MNEKLASTLQPKVQWWLESQESIHTPLLSNQSTEVIYNSWYLIIYYMPKSINLGLILYY